MMLRSTMTRAAAATLVLGFLANPVTAKVAPPMLADRYDDCLEQRCQVYVDRGDFDTYEFCRRDCERRFPPQ